MPRPRALHFALDLAHTPTLGRLVQREPLPDGVLDVIRIAAGCPETTAQAARATGLEPEALQPAAAVWLQTALFAPQADHYRVLGVARTASADEIRSHMRWLMKWLHPDRQNDAWQSRPAERVLAAWDELKTPERRAGYDRTHPAAPSAAKARSRRLWRRPWLPRVDRPAPAPGKGPGWGVRLAVILMLGAVAVTAVVAGDWLARTGPAMEASGAE